MPRLAWTSRSRMPILPRPGGRWRRVARCAVLPDHEYERREDDVTLVLGPLLRRVVGDRATIWVETAEPATVEIAAGAAAGGAARTFAAFGRHYALVVVDGLPRGEATPYQVILNGERAWPPAEYAYPA